MARNFARPARASSSTRRSGARSTCSTCTGSCSPEQVVYASDYPYGRQPNSLLMAVRTARACGLRRRAGARAARARPPHGSPTASSRLPPARHRRGRRGPQPITFARIHQYLSMAATLLWTRQRTRSACSGSRLNACDERSNGHREADRADPGAARRDARALGPASETADDADRRRAQRGAFRLLHLANVLAVTSCVALSGSPTRAAPPAVSYRAARRRRARSTSVASTFASTPTAGCPGAPRAGRPGRARAGCSRRRPRRA